MEKVLSKALVIMCLVYDSGCKNGIEKRKQDVKSVIGEEFQIVLAQHFEH